MMTKPPSGGLGSVASVTASCAVVSSVGVGGGVGAAGSAAATRTSTVVVPHATAAPVQAPILAKRDTGMRLMAAHRSCPLRA